MSSVKRGFLIVFEGIDRSGKSTQVQMLTSYLNSKDIPCVNIKFPNRASQTGKIINSYLIEQNFEDSKETIHLLFSANRWESMSEMRKQLEIGRTIIVDRYAFSGAAYSSGALKLDFQWCKNPDKGLLCPDMVLYLDVHPSKCSTRDNYGEERYENIAIQNEVYKCFKTFENEPYWKNINAQRNIMDVHNDIVSHVDLLFESAKEETPELKCDLWSN